MCGVVHHVCATAFADCSRLYRLPPQLTLVAAAAVTAALSKAICKLNGVEDPFAALRDAITPNLDSKAEGGEP